MTMVESKDGNTHGATVLEGAYDTSSGGLAIHAHALPIFITGGDLPSWVETSIAHPNSNFLVGYWAWSEKKYPMKREGNPSKSPNLDAHVRLFDVMEEEYAGLHRAMVRITLGGEDTLKADPTLPIDEDEFESLLITADKAGIIEYDPRTSERVKPFDNYDKMIVNLAIAQVLKIAEPIKAQWNKTVRAEKFKVPLQRAATHKLGAMLGLVEQYAFEADALENPIHKDYVPDYMPDVRDKTWQTYFGKPVMPIVDLYRFAHDIFRTSVEPNDPLVTHLMQIRELSYLV